MRQQLTETNVEDHPSTYVICEDDNAPKQQAGQQLVPEELLER
jgi:hypothetical protein